MCITAEELLDFPIQGCQNAEICCSESSIDDRIAEAIDLVEKLTGQWLCPRDVCIKVMPSKDSKVLFFPPEVIRPAIEIDSISKGGVAQTFEFDLYPHHLVAHDKCFYCCEYEVCGSFGYETIPPSLKRATMILALEFLQPGITGYAKPFGVSRADWGDFSVSYRLEQGFESFGATTGIREVDNIIQQHINYAGMFNFMSTSCPPKCGSCGCDTGEC